MLPQSGLYDVGLDGEAHAHLVVVRDGEAPPALVVQVGVGRLGALWSFADDGEGVGSLLSVWEKQTLRECQERGKQSGGGGRGHGSKVGVRKSRMRMRERLSKRLSSPWGVRHRGRRGDVQIKDGWLLLLG